ncbi:transcriptional regulator [Corynebacterium striatum]|uniref:Transcriptional regulator n=2 Tax=Corynebacterium striatum TaxID=43770 RepID=A0ABC9ZQ32_CORST|nr:GntR family transcriptional regulator [Corynebacterium striatum]EEI79673.1 FCD domain protein [Corynebacterium striatum ATCC 6940]MDK8825145.1 GntR family transcriptional regulator [Corynebacterium striatum]STD36026.1 transcriptional regulator [Corynebacterium striatum]STD61816.1 transcriptional regulator [Corynebacterium striatum]GEA44071.1 transcriptional regulator [Corynebacterium striatum]
MATNSPAAQSSSSTQPARAMALAVTPAKNLATQVMNYVRDCAQNGSMAPGEWYSVYKLSEELGISRSPVRDGLLRLEEAGLIEFSRNRGFQIVETKPSDVADIFDMRLALEPRIAARAALARSDEQLAQMRALLQSMEASVQSGNEPEFFSWDKQLHDAILVAGGSTRARDTLDKLRTHTQILTDSTVRNERSLEQVHSEHVPIIDAIAKGDAQRARQDMASHITATGRLLLRQTLRRRNPQLSEAEAEQRVEEIWDAHTREL